MTTTNTSKTFKQIAKLVEDGRVIKAVKSMYFSRTRCSENYRVRIDGEWFSVSAASWNKMVHNLRVNYGEVEEESPFRRIHCTVVAR